MRLRGEAVSGRGHSRMADRLGDQDWGWGGGEEGGSQGHKTLNFKKQKGPGTLGRICPDSLHEHHSLHIKVVH